MNRYLPIRQVYAREVLDSRGNPTVETEVTVGEGIVGKDGYTGKSIVPSGASTGKYEALELRDKENRYCGQGVLKAVENVNDKLAECILGENVLNQRHIDTLLKREDGTENNSAEIRNNINSKGTEVDEAESHIVGAEVNAIKTGINITATEVTKTKTGIDTTGTNIHAAGTGINATKTVTDESAMKINAAKKREIAATIPQTKQETDTEIESKSETDTEIKSKPERERDKERERQSKTENEWEKDREQLPVPSNGVFQAAPVAVKGLSLEISSGKRGEENKEERRNEGIDQKGETRYNGIQYERNQLEEAKYNGTQYERNQQEEAKYNGTQYERSQQEKAPNESTASGGFSESLLRLNMDAIGIRNEPTVKAILALARRRKLGGPCGTLWKVLSSEYRSTLLKKNEPGDYILWALNHSAEFEDTYNGILKKRVRGR